MAQKFDVHNPSGFCKESETQSKGPSSLQGSCKTALLQANGIDKTKDLRKKLDLPAQLLQFLTKQFATEDFFINGDEVTAEDIKSGTYRAVCLIDNKQVLLKCIPFEQATEEKFVEIKKWEETEVDGLQKCFLNFREKDKLFYVMEYWPFTICTLIRSVQSKGKRLQEETVWYILSQIIKPLLTLHEKKMLYHELNSDKVIVCNDGQIKLENCMLHVTDQASVMEQFVLDDSGVQGIYTSPEVISGEDPSWAAVVWAVGCIAYEMVQMKPAFAIEDASNVFGTLNDIVEGKMPESITDGYGDKIKQLVTTCLTSDTENRPSISEICKTISVNCPKAIDEAVKDIQSCM